MYRAGVEGILGIRRAGSVVTVKPCIPMSWPGFDVTLAIDGSQYEIRVDNVSGRGRGVSAAYMDGVALACEAGEVSLPLDGRRHGVVITL
jgi:cyclic beta-1,2-glucan synthetase